MKPIIPDPRADASEADTESGADDDAPARPSKTEIKRAMDALQDMGRELLELADPVLARLDLPDDLRDALRDWKRFSGREARRRQLQYIGRVMRGLDAEPIAAQLAALRGESAREAAHQHELERWRERLLATDGALTDLLADYPGADIPHLRQLIRAARQETATGKPPKSARALFRVLRDLIRPEREAADPARDAGGNEGPG